MTEIGYFGRKRVFGGQKELRWDLKMETVPFQLPRNQKKEKAIYG